MKKRYMWTVSTVFIFVAIVVQTGCTSSEFRGGGAGKLSSPEDTTAIEAGNIEKVEATSIDAGYDFESETTESREDTSVVFVESVEPLDTTAVIEEIEKLGSDYTVGYRIQVFATGDLDKAESMKKEAVAKTGLSGYIEYEGGLYKVRLGNFRTRSDAEENRTRLKKIYPDCWIVQTTIVEQEGE